MEKQSNMEAIRLIDLINERGQNDNVPAAKRGAAGGADAYSYLRVEADGSVSDFIVPTDDEIDLLILISEIAASSEEAEAAVAAEARRMYLRKWGIAIAGVALLCSAILLL